MNPFDVTFIVPIFKLDSYRINNLTFILPYLKSTGCRVLVVEQTDRDESDVSHLTKDVEHILFKTKEARFHKTGIINYAVSNHVTTKYAWVNDVDYYMKFNAVLNCEWNESFIQPYKIAKKLNKKDTTKILNSEIVNVDYSDGSVKYISLYGALSFIFEVDEFLNAGAMDESIYGWGYEDVELSKRISEKYKIQKIDLYGVHLYHSDKLEDIYMMDVDNKDMAVLTCHFNWCGYNTPVKNLNSFINRMHVDGVPLYGVELSLTNDFVTENIPNWYQIKVTKENVCFQKEACINLLEKKIPKKYTKIAWIDGDIMFTNKNWYNDASSKLNEYKLVQLYERGIDTDKRGKSINITDGIVYAGGPRTDPGYFGHPGGAIAVRREFFDNGGLYIHSFMGSGDSILMYTIYNVPMRHIPDDTYKVYHEWKKKIQSYINKADVSFIKGNFIHDWHGDKNSRNYIERNKIFSSVNIDKNITVDSNGLLHISGISDGIYEDIMSYFRGRKEDGTVEINKTLQDMAVVSVFYNWAGFSSPIKNLNNFIRHMDANNIPLYGVELSLNGKFITEKYPNWIKIKVSKENICFQKEACINLLEKFIPEKYTKIAWIDCDIFFKNKNWYNEASEKLSSYKVIQLFSKELFTNRLGYEINSIPCLLSVGGPNTEVESRKYLGTPGAALAARRDLWKKGGGLFPFSFMGGGDSVFMYTLYNNTSDKNVNRASGYQKKFKLYLDWSEKVRKYVNGSCSWIDGDIVHSWHGDRENRQYTSRHDISDNINWQKTLCLDERGIIHLKGLPNSTYAEIYMYFKNRNEDGEDIS